MARPQVTEIETVLDAAADLIALNGIGGTTVDAIAQRAGVSRATVYRYVGGKDEIVQAVIAQEAEHVLERVAAAISVSTSPDMAIAEAVSTALAVIAENPVLTRLTSSDLHETLPFITAESRLLIDHSVSVLSNAMRAAPELTVDEGGVEDAIEESTRFVLTHLTTPRRDGSTMSALDAGARAATLIAPMMLPIRERG